MYAGDACTGCATITLNFDTMTGNAVGGFHEDGNNDPITITNSIFDNNNCIGLYASWGWPLVMQGNDISGNQGCTGLMFWVSGPATVTNNSISGNDNPGGGGGWPGGVYIDDNSGGGIFSDNVISGDVGYGGAALQVDGCGPDFGVQNNLFEYNTATAYSVIRLSTGCSNVAVEFEHNTLLDNTAAGSETADGPSTMDVWSNQTVEYNNLLDPNDLYEVATTNGAGSAPLDATNNWWGTSSEAGVAQRMFEPSGSSSRGAITYVPFLDAPDGQAPVPPPTSTPAVTPTPTDTPTDTPVGSGYGTSIYGGSLSADTEWTLAGSPYDVVGSLDVPAGVTLTIDAGVIVQFENGQGLTVEGTLRALGQAGQTVDFYAAEGTWPGLWAGIAFNGAVPARFDSHGAYLGGSTLQYLRMYYAGTSGAGITLNASSPYLDNVIVGETNGWGVLIQNGFAPVIDGSDIVLNTSHGIGIYNSSPTIRHTTVELNSGYGIYMQYGSPVLLDDTVQNNGASGFYMDGYGVPTISGSTFTGNNGNGVYIGTACSWCGNAVVLRNDTMTNNQGAGFHEDGNWDPLTIVNSVFSGNTNWGLYESWGDPLEIAGNIITGNQSFPGLAFYAGGPANITNNVIENNSNPGGNWVPSGGVYAYFSGNDEVFAHNVISGNLGGTAAALYMDYSGADLQMRDNLFENNVASWGSIIRINDRGSALYFEHNTLANNTAAGSDSSNASTTLDIWGTPIIEHNNLLDLANVYELSYAQGSPRRTWMRRTTGGIRPTSVPSPAACTTMPLMAVAPS